MKNIYDGVVTLDANGAAQITMPSWFDALNTDFRYQLTAIGAPAANLYVAEEIAKRQFKIAGGKPHLRCRGRSPVFGTTPAHATTTRRSKRTRRRRIVGRASIRRRSASPSRWASTISPDPRVC